jgi:hypothetical protein
MFFSYQVPCELSIKGYSDRFPWGRTWWNLSLPPGWRELVSLPLPEVCARSWRTHNEWILRDVAPLVADGTAMIVRYEDLVADPVTTMAAVGRVAELAPVPAWRDARLPVVMTQTAPDPDKWRRWEPEIRSVLPLVKDVATALGYDGD